MLLVPLCRSRKERGPEGKRFGIGVQRREEDGGGGKSKGRGEEGGDEEGRLGGCGREGKKRFPVGFKVIEDTF